mmetsp:Transcript_8533/g.23061  ORF Transcript_8533/g.23061 Transcript_8533/m.23061 type:complete len:191 (-) Transcript_8533:40-612(-)
MRKMSGSSWKQRASILLLVGCSFLASAAAFMLNGDAPRHHRRHNNRSQCDSGQHRQLQHQQLLLQAPSRSRSAVVMRDTSASYWFTAGDTVRVVEDVTKAGHNLKDRIGTVVETWEKCEVDPTCCCAEQVDNCMAVRVEFKGSEAGDEITGDDDADSSDDSRSGNDDGFFFHFAEDELIKVKVPSSAPST